MWLYLLRSGELKVEIRQHERPMSAAANITCVHIPGIDITRKVNCLLLDITLLFFLLIFHLLLDPPVISHNQQFALPNPECGESQVHKEEEHQDDYEYASDCAVCWRIHLNREQQERCRQSSIRD
jgi:hypothetical protein